MVTAAQRRQAVQHLKRSRISSERRACRLAGLSRAVARYRLLGRDYSALREQLRSLAEVYPRYGYPTLHDRLKSKGWVINRKRTYRLYRDEGLQVRYLSGVRSSIGREYQCSSLVLPTSGDPSTLCPISWLALPGRQCCR